MFIPVEFKSNSEMLPKFQLPMVVSDIKIELVKEIENIVDVEERNILDMYPPFLHKETNINPEAETGLEDWVTNRAFEYNFLKMVDKYPILNDLKTSIREAYDEYSHNMNLSPVAPYIQMWFNVLRKDGRFFTKHHHAHPARIGDPLNAYISGHVCIRAENTSTYYYNPFIQDDGIGMKNKPGNITLFPSWVLHSTDQNKSEQTRITLAFDILPEQVVLEGKMDNPSNYIRL